MAATKRIFTPYPTPPRPKQTTNQAKAYTLHKALNATMAASKSQSVKMQRIIAHLQASAPVARGTRTTAFRRASVLAY